LEANIKIYTGIGNVTANRVYESLALAEISKRDVPQGDEIVKHAGFVDSLRSAADRVSRGAKRGLEELIKLLEILVSDEHRNKPANQITLVLENGYEQYLLENFENAESRAEDIRGLAQYAGRYESTEDFLSELALLSTERSKNRLRLSVKTSCRAAKRTNC